MLSTTMGFCAQCQSAATKAGKIYLAYKHYKKKLFVFLRYFFAVVSVNFTFLTKPVFI